MADTYKTGTASPLFGTLVARFEFKMGGENEDTWSSQGVPEFVGVYDGQRPVRIVRQVQGAQSGTHTTRYDFIYPTYFVTRVNLRVHPIPELFARLRQDAGVAALNPTPRIWTQTGFETTPQTARDPIGGQGPETEQINDSQARYPDWTQIATSERGSYAHFVKEPRAPVAEQRSYTYQDWHEGARIGLFGRYLKSIGLTQDGAFPPDYGQCPGCALNDGGCVANDPESGNLNFARFEWVVMPLAPVNDPLNPLLVKGGEANSNFVTPLNFATRKQHRDYDDLPPVAPCTPSVTPVGTSNNGIVDLTVNATGCSSGTGFRLFRAVGAGPSLPLRDLRTATSTRDLSVKPGTTYVHRVRAYNEVNSEGADSSPVTVAVTDTVAPTMPFNLVVTPGSQQLTATWNGGTDRDIYGFDVWMSSDGGSTYSKVSATPIPAWVDARWRQMNVESGQVRCFKVAAVDVQGNASAPTDPVCGTAQP